MTDSAGEHNANGDHSVIQVREEGERCEREIIHAVNQTWSGNENSEDELALASLIGTKLPQELGTPRDPTFIFRVPNKLVRDNENAFVPQVVSIGPYHHGGKRLQAMEQIKLWYLKRLLHRKPTPYTSLVHFVKEIRSREEFLRNHYDEKLDHLTSDQFVEMMVVDGCFILELIRTNQTEDGDPVFSVPWMLSRVSSDLFLLENQIPWTVVDCLFNLTTASEGSSLYNGTFSLIEQFFPSFVTSREIGYPRHLLDGVRNCLFGFRPPYKSTYYGYWTPIPSVTHLEEIGVTFQRAPYNEKAPLDITFNFEKGVMEIPWMRFRANAVRVIKNLIAYDQCSLTHQECAVLSCTMLFNHLIKSTKDLESLVQKGIIETEFSKEDTVCLFNRLCNDTERISSFYFELAMQVNKYYGRR